jgi:hypothetical protein
MPAEYNQGYVESSELGSRFWLSVLGVVVAVGVGVLLFFWLIGAAWYRWGAIGALLFFAALALLFAYVYDRRQAKKYADEL